MNCLKSAMTAICLEGLILFFIFLGLRLSGMTDWPWFWVAFPAWAPPAFILCMGLIGLSITKSDKGG